MNLQLVTLLAALWYFINGLLHDVFVIKQHQGKYNRELLRLLMDGHVLLLSGVLLLINRKLLSIEINYTSFINISIGIFMLLYCALIFPFLKSFGTILVSIILIGFSILNLLS